MELSQLGDLRMNLVAARLLPSRDELTDKQKIDYSLQVARGMNHLVSKGVRACMCDTLLNLDVCGLVIASKLGS